MRWERELYEEEEEEMVTTSKSMDKSWEVARLGEFSYLSTQILTALGIRSTFPFTTSVRKQNEIDYSKNEVNLRLIAVVGGG